MLNYRLGWWPRFLFQSAVKGSYLASVGGTPLLYNNVWMFLKVRLARGASFDTFFIKYAPSGLSPRNTEEALGMILFA